MAISRCRTLKGIHLVDGDITVEDIKICQRAYDFQYGDLVKEMELPAEPEVEIEPEGVIGTNIPQENSLEMKISAQSIRFKLAGDFDSNLVLVTDADIVPISKSHFYCPDNFDGILHLNANEYYSLGGMRYPACYYVMNSTKWRSLCNPCGLEFGEWIRFNVRPLRYGVDELIAAKALSKCPIIKRYISKTERVDIDNYKKLDKLSEIKDFHFHYFNESEVINVYNKILEKVNVKGR